MYQLVLEDDSESESSFWFGGSYSFLKSLPNIAGYFFLCISFSLSSKVISFLEVDSVELSFKFPLSSSILILKEFIISSLMSTIESNSLMIEMRLFLLSWIWLYSVRIVVKNFSKRMVFGLFNFSFSFAPTISK